ncbi:MAG: tyrosine-type recombinase/integrase [Spirochaetes bacterium]|nr:tyrosine-type recombinase/integrase [Spirochaetota bacterium]
MANFSTFPRKKKNGKSVYYVQFKKSDGSYDTAKSSGCTSRYAAEAWAEDYLLKHGRTTLRDVLFIRFAENFFDWNGTWATNKKVQGKRISQSHCLTTAETLQRHILPVFQNYNIADIDKLKIRDFRNKLYQQGKSGSLINKCLYALKAILEAAEDQGLIQAVPRIEKAADKPKTKGILTIEEVRRLFYLPWASIPSYSHPVKERYIGYVGNLLACVTGLRLGELQGLLLTDLHLDSGYIVVRRSWDRKINRLNETTKNGRERNLLIPSYVISLVSELVERNPYKQPDSFLFYSKFPHQPIDAKTFINDFFAALDRIGINKDERKKRNITFHSHRHWFNSLLLNAKVPLHKVQSLTGHLSTEMSGHYYHIDDMQDVRQIQEELFNPKVN